LPVARVKILILKPSSLGDVVQALPVLRLIKRHWPHSEIHWWLAAELEPLLQDDPDLAAVIPFHRQRWKFPWHWPEVLASIRHIRAEKFDWVIDLQGLARSGVLAWLANGARTIGLPGAREGAVGCYDSVAPAMPDKTHAVSTYLGVLPLLGIPIQDRFQFAWLPGRAEVAAAVRQKWPVGERRWFVINPGARWWNKCWPVEHFRELVSRLAARHAEVHFVILGGRSDLELGRVIAQGAPARCLDLTGQTTLPEMVEWIRLGELMISNDTGPMHVAAALGKPVVAMFGPTDPLQTGPYRQIGDVLRLKLPCAPCLKAACHHEPEMECLRAIPPEMVLTEVARRLRQG